jgi:hypothetical protein
MERVRKKMMIGFGQALENDYCNLKLQQAPPSIEGSFAAIENLMFRQDFASPKDVAHISESEEQLRANPSYSEYYWAHVNLNPRLPPPLVSGENQNLYRNRTGYNRRLTSYNDSFRLQQLFMVTSYGVVIFLFIRKNLTMIDHLKR